MLNQFIVVGRVFKELELRETKNGKSVLDLPIAINNGKDDTTYLTVQLFGLIADNTNKYIHKGDLVGIKGNIKNNNWEDKEGKKHYDYSFIAEKVTFLSTNKKSEDVKDESNKKNSVEIKDEDLPF